MNPTGILEDWANQLSRTHKSGTIYVDGIKVDIDNLGITISSMELIYIVDDIFSYTVVRSDTDEVDYYTIKCIFDSEKPLMHTIHMDIYSGKNVSRIHWSKVIGKHIHDNYGNTYPSNLDVLRKLIRMAERTISLTMVKDKAISLFETDVPTKRAD